MKGPVIGAAGIALALVACGDNRVDLSGGTTYVEPSAQRVGNSPAGYDYLVHGNYVNSGVPLALFLQARGSSRDELGRVGDAAEVAYDYNVVERNGEKFAAPNCLSCHASRLFGKLVVGLGDSTVDFSTSQRTYAVAAEAVIKQSYGENSPQYKGARPFLEGTMAIADQIVTEVRGVNPADKLFAVLAAHRDAPTLAWTNTANTSIPEEVPPVDTPAWWNVKYKNALYHTAGGQGDFARLSTASGMLTLREVSEAQAADARFPDLIAWIETLEPPQYPFAIDADLAAAGEVVFEDTCARCHGTYGSSKSYPNLVVDVETVGTDGLLATAYDAGGKFFDWYNQSWYGQGPNSAQLKPSAGYIAPPLRGVWATAPYFHNGSVPTIAGVLQSKSRPQFWKRTFKTEMADYDQQAVGWKYEVPGFKVDGDTYDTTSLGYGNGGHTFGDDLSQTDRAALLEYLKTL